MEAIRARKRYRAKDGTLLYLDGLKPGTNGKAAEAGQGCAKLKQVDAPRRRYRNADQQGRFA